MSRTIVISDTHFGADQSAGTPDQLRHLWSGADRLIVNGDVAELQDPARRARAARLVSRLQELCHADGVELSLISGNHDPLLTDERYLELADGAIFITHGDVLHPAISPWGSSADEVRTFNVDALSSLDETERTDVLGRLAAAQHAAAQACRTRKAVSTVRQSFDLARRCAAILYYWHVMPKLAAEFAETHAPRARFFVFGHMHRAGVWTIRDVNVINTGCFGQPRLEPYAVIVDDEQVVVRSIQHAGDGLYSFGRGTVKAWALAEAAERRSDDATRGAAGAGVS